VKRPKGERRRGNRLWRVETPEGPVLQKFYRPKAGLLRDAWRGVMSRIVRGASGSSPDVRCRTEGELLALWREAGVDVPRDLTESHRHLAGPRVRILEWVEGVPLSDVLAAAGSNRAARDTLLKSAGVAWGKRHAAAEDRRDPRLVQFHAGFMHLLVSNERMVAIDLEQGYLPVARELAPVVLLARLAREVAACLRTLAKHRDDATLRADLAALAAGHPRPALLLAAAGHALRGGGPLRGLVRALDRRRAEKERPLRMLEEILAKPSAGR
jgi:hypothetical protein